MAFADEAPICTSSAKLNFPTGVSSSRSDLSGSGKHSDLLNRVAKQAGYDHWHHVIQCNEAAKATKDLRTIRGECEAVIASEMRGDVKVVMTGPELKLGPFVLFSTGIGDAWLLKPDEHLAMCMVWQGARQEIGVPDDPARVEIAWDCEYELLGDFFRVESNAPCDRLARDRRLSLGRCSAVG